MTARLQLIGQRFGRLTVVRLHAAARYTHWLCACDCGGQRVIVGRKLMSGETKSCGCLLREHYARTLPVKSKVSVEWRELAEVMRIGKAF
jgi:hypothetical protein